MVVATFVGLSPFPCSPRAMPWILGSLGSFLLRTCIFVPMPVAATGGLRDRMLHLSSVSGVRCGRAPHPPTQRHFPQDSVSETSLLSGVMYLVLFMLFLVTQGVVFRGYNETTENHCFPYSAASRRLPAKSLQSPGLCGEPTGCPLSTGSTVSSDL